MILPCLNGPFGGVAAVAVWRDSLEVNVVLLEGLFHFVGALVVENVEYRCVAIRLEVGMELFPGLGEFAGLAGFQRRGEDSVAVIIIEDHDVVVAAGGLDGEFSGLIGVGLLECGSW